MEERTWCESMYVLLTETFLNRNQSVLCVNLPSPCTDWYFSKLIVTLLTQPSQCLNSSPSSISPFFQQHFWKVILSMLLKEGVLSSLLAFLFLRSTLSSSLLSYLSSSLPSTSWRNWLTGVRWYRCEPYKVSSTLKSTRKLCRFFNVRKYYDSLFYLLHISWICCSVL